VAPFGARSAGSGPAAVARDDPSPRPPLRAWRWLLAGCGALIAVYPFVPSGLRIGLYHVVGVTAVAAMLAGIRMNRLPRPLPWLLLAAAQVAFIVGDVLWDVYDVVLETPPSPAPADILYLAGYPLMGAAFAILARRRCRSTREGLIDAAIVTIGAATVCWVFLMAPYATDDTLTTAERLVAVAYPLGDVVLLAMAVRLFLVPGRAAPGRRLLGAGLLAVLVADVVYATLTLADSTLIPLRFLDTGWLAGYALMGAALLHPTIRPLTEPAPPRSDLARSRLWLLAGASLLAPATLAAQSVRGADAYPLFIALSSAALFGLVVIRMRGLVHRVEEQAVALARAALTDALTGAPNRRAWDERLAVEIARAERTDAPVSIAMLDLDHFKAFNDEHGHQAGDRLLRETTDAWRAELRTLDLLARYGGEEFGVILPGCRLDEAAATVERLRRLTPGGQTSSAGVATWDGRESADDFVARTDRALYAAKHAGRDRTTTAAPAALAA
jgi:diguanylate cyclase (GGDEF)-like protein